MASANPLTEPDRDIPLTEIPKTIRDLRASWAQAYSRAEKLERERAEAQQSAEDWRHIALHNGDEAAQLRVTLARIQRDDAELSVLRKFASDIWDSVEGGYSADAALRFEWIRDSLHELIETDEVGDSCSYCSGWDDRTDEPRSCSECHHGRVLRGAF